MKKSDVEIGGTYWVKVSGKLAEVRIDAESRHGGWDATNLETKKRVRIESAQRLRSAVRGGSAAAQATASAGATDPERCATVGCDGEAVIEHLGRARCQRCWDDEAGAADAATPASDGQTVPTDAPRANRSRKSAQAAGKGGGGKPKRGGKAAAGPARGKAKRAPTTATDGAADAKPKRVSALDAAAEILRTGAQAMRATEMITAMAERGLWTSPNGKTPHATLYAAILREISSKGGESRFKKVAAGKFEYAGPATR